MDEMEFKHAIYIYDLSLYDCIMDRRIKASMKARNMDKYLIQADGQGIPVTIVRKKMKTVRLKVNRDGVVVLSAPHAVTDRWIGQYIESKAVWIQKQLKRAHAQRQAIPPIIRSGEPIRILGRDYIMRVSPSGKKAVRMTDTHLEIETREPDDQESLNRQLDRWWRSQAMERYTISMRKYYPVVEQHGVKMPAITVRRMKTLWGSCSAHRGVVTLNYYLYKLPLPCIDYIVFHELTHFLYRYHDRDFYGFIARYMPDWKERNRVLKSEYPG